MIKILTTASEDAIRATFVTQLGGFGLARFLRENMRKRAGERVCCCGRTNLMATVVELSRLVPGMDGEDG